MMAVNIQSMVQRLLMELQLTNNNNRSNNQLLSSNQQPNNSQQLSNNRMPSSSLQMHKLSQLPNNNNSKTLIQLLRYNNQLRITNNRLHNSQFKKTGKMVLTQLCKSHLKRNIKQSSWLQVNIGSKVTCRKGQIPNLLTSFSLQKQVES